jgi:hypothetical protein
MKQSPPGAESIQDTAIVCRHENKGPVIDRLIEILATFR